MSEKFLEGRVALVTGGASGMGKAMALALAGAGADVAIGSLLAGAARAEGEVSYLPGEKELETQQQRLAEGIPLPDYVWEELQATAGKVGVPVPTIG